MNFTTDLPKKDPLVSYIVASAVKCEKFFPGSVSDGPVYRMHAVILKKKNPRLQLPPMTPRNEAVQSPDIVPLNSSGQQDSDAKQMPRSSHGRVLTQSRRLKAAVGVETPPAIAQQYSNQFSASS